MRYIIILGTLSLLSFPVQASALLSAIEIDPTAEPPRQSFPQVAVMCFKTGEQISGMNKICYYDCLGSGTAITIRSTQLCPLSINR
jgi:hypothetical protein